MRHQLVPLLNLKLPLLKQQLLKLLRLLLLRLLLLLLLKLLLLKLLQLKLQLLQYSRLLKLIRKFKQRWMQQQQSIQDNKKLLKLSLIISLTKATAIEISSMNSIALSVTMHQLPIQAIV